MTAKALEVRLDPQEEEQVAKARTRPRGWEVQLCLASWAESENGGTLVAQVEED